MQMQNFMFDELGNEKEHQADLDAMTSCQYYGHSFHEVEGSNGLMRCGDCGEEYMKVEDGVCGHCLQNSCECEEVVDPLT